MKPLILNCQVGRSERFRDALLPGARLACRWLAVRFCTMNKLAEGPKKGWLYFCAERLFVCFLQATQMLGISIHLVNRVTQSDQIATRGLGSSTGRVPRKFCLIEP